MTSSRETEPGYSYNPGGVLDCCLYSTISSLTFRKVKRSSRSSSLPSDSEGMSTGPYVTVDDRHGILRHQPRRDPRCPRRHVTNFRVLTEWSQQRRSNLRLQLFRLLSLFLFRFFFFFFLALLHRVPPLTATLCPRHMQPTGKGKGKGKRGFV